MLLLLILTSPVLLRAQFQPPTPEELRMTADPKAPGAAAVYLDVEEATDDLLHYKSFHARIKVLAEKGKDLATVEIPYERSNFKVSDIKGRTIHADGTVVPLTGKPEDLLVAKVTFKQGDEQFNRKVFTLPSVEVGSILEYSYQIHYEDHHVSSPHWEIQQPYFIHQAHYSFTPLAMYSARNLGGRANQSTDLALDEDGTVATFLLWTTLLPSGTNVKADNFGHYLVDLTDIPASPNEEWMPPIHSFLYSVKFYYKDANDSAGYWKDAAKRWSRDVDSFAESKPLRDAVSGLIAPSDSDLDKAKKLYQAVQALENTDFSRTKSESERKQLNLKTAKKAIDTWNQKSGSGNDLALLYLAMLRAAGLNAAAMKVANRDERLFDPSYLSLNQQLDDILVILNLADKAILLDPGQKMCPFQTVHWKHESANGIRQSADGSFAAGSPASTYTANNFQRTGDVIIDEHGAATGVFHFSMTGQLALRWRQAALLNDETETKKQFDRWLESMVPEGIEAHIDSFTGLDNPDVLLLATVKAKGNLGASTSKRLMLPAYFFETRGTHPFVNQDKRIESVDMQYGEVTADQVVFHLPAGFSVEGAPQDTKIPWPGYATLVTKSKIDPGQITIARIFSRAFTLLKPEQYQDLRGFYQKIAAADQGELVLTTAPAAPKGN
ncbi:MAG: DUF3857 domain-containing protein [Terracidiphilus sp.]